MIKILVADDHAIVRQGLKMIFKLSSDIELVGEVGDFDGIMQYLRNSTHCDLLLTDMQMPGVNGVSLIEHVKAYRKELPILVFSMSSDVQIVLRVLKAGVAGYISKDKPPEVLLDAIRKVAAGGKYVDPQLAEIMLFEGLSNTQREPHTALSNRETEVYALMADGKRVSEIANLLHISDKTVSSHKKRLMEKMHVSSVADLLRYSMEHRLFEDNNKCFSANLSSTQQASAETGQM